MKTKILIAVLSLLPSLATAFQSPLDSEADCNAWKASLMGWFRENHVQLVGKEKEIIIACNQDGKEGRWTGYIAYRMSDERAKKVAAITRNLNCAAPGGASQRGIASESTQIMDSPCKIAANDIKLFQKEILAPSTPVGAGMSCCGNKSWISCGMAAAVEPLCKIKCGPCVQVVPGGMWR